MKSIKEVFNERTCYKFSNKKIPESVLVQIYDLMKLGPTSGNSCPLRIVFVSSMDEKEKLYKCLNHGNVDKTKSAPVSAIFAYDVEFYKLMHKLHPEGVQLVKYFSSSNDIALDTAIRNSTLQAAYFMIIARSMGIACGPMSGFNHQLMNGAFFAESTYRANFICNLGYEEEANPFPKLPRLEFTEACKIL